MTRKLLSTWGMIIVLLVSIVGTAAAQSGTEPVVTPEVTPTAPVTHSQFYAHPVVQIMAAYFARNAGTTDVEPTETPTVDPADPSATPAPEEPAALTPEELAEQIAQYHEAGMGFGVLVKLYAMAEASAEKCASAPAPETSADGTPVEPCKVVTVDELVTAVKGGAGMGTLFKTYGKPALLGVGHVKKAAKNQPTMVADDPTTIEDESAVTPETKNGKPAKVKTPKPNQGNGNGNGKNK